MPLKYLLQWAICMSTRTKEGRIPGTPLRKESSRPSFHILLAQSVMDLQHATVIVTIH